MRIILSRKGFDSTAGGCPSPIFPDGRMLSLPIPDKGSSIAYQDLSFGDMNVGDLVVELTGDAKRSRHFAHLDPDLRADSLPRLPGWKPLLGQTGSAQGHLRKQGVQAGDVFLFFGSFRPVEQTADAWRFKRTERARHIIWGWMQIGRIHKVDELPGDEMRWARYHPHFAYSRDASNTLYESADRLVIGAAHAHAQGAGVFTHFDQRLVLTAPESNAQTSWRLPSFLVPVDGRSQLSYHGDARRWQVADDECLLNSVARGQEFVFDTQGQDAPIQWILSLLESIPSSN